MTSRAAAVPRGAPNHAAGMTPEIPTTHSSPTARALTTPEPLSREPPNRENLTLPVPTVLGSLTRPKILTRETLTPQLRTILGAPTLHESLTIPEARRVALSAAHGAHTIRRPAATRETHASYRFVVPT